MPESSAIRTMFGQIARRYDLANRLLSGGMDRWWLHCLVKKVARLHPSHITDLATGSGDVAFSLARKIPSAQVHGLDFCQPMLDEAQRKLETGSGDAARVSFSIGDCLSLPLPDNSTDVVTIAYGVRNFEKRAQGLGEIHRILRPGGTAFILEFTQPWCWFRPLYYFYLRFLLPGIARLATGNRHAYDYLVASIARFPDKQKFAEELRSAGFVEVSHAGLTASIVAIHQARKANAS